MDHVCKTDYPADLQLYSRACLQAMLVAPVHGLRVIRAEGGKSAVALLCPNSALNNRCIVFKCVRLYSGRKKDLPVSVRCFAVTKCACVGLQGAAAWPCALPLPCASEGSRFDPRHSQACVAVCLSVCAHMQNQDPRCP